MTSKKDKLLNKNKDGSIESYDLNEDEKVQLAAIIALFQQAQNAQDILYSNLIKNISDRLEISNATLDINMSEVMQEGTKIAKLLVKR
jgi:hypothetical protein